MSTDTETDQASSNNVIQRRGTLFGDGGGGGPVRVASRLAGPIFGGSFGGSFGGGLHVALPEMAISFARGMVIQAWVRPSVKSASGTLLRLGRGDAKVIFGLADGAPTLQVGGLATCTAPFTLPGDRWTRIAVVLRGKSVTFYRGDEAFAGGKLDAAPIEVARDGNFIAKAKAFAGAIAEVRLWNQSDSADSIIPSGDADLRGDEPGLVGWWTLEGAEGALDRSPFGRDGALRGGAFSPGSDSFTVRQPVERCLDFGAGLGVVDTPAFRLGKAVTWQAHVRIRNRKREATLLQIGGDPEPFVRVTTKRGKLTATVTTEKATTTTTTTALLKVDTWTSVALRIGDDEKLDLFVDGVRVGDVSVDSVPAPKSTVIGAAFFMVKNLLSRVEAHFGAGLDGQMAEVRLWSRALSSAEIEDTWKRRIHGWAPGLVGCWRMDEEVLPSPSIRLGATIFEDGDFKGKSKSLNPGRYDVAKIGIGNDALSSIRVPLGLKVTVFQHGGFAGTSTTYIQDSPLVADNDDASSIVVEGRPGLINGRGAGPQAWIHGAQPAPREGLVLGSAPRVAPVRVAGLDKTDLTLPTVPAISGAGFTAQMWVNLDPSDGPAPILTLSGAGSVTVFKKSDYRGASQTLGIGEHDVDALTMVGNDQISSIKVPPGLRATLHGDAGFAGSRSTYEKDAANLSASKNDATSSITVEALPVITLTASPTDGGFDLDVKLGSGLGLFGGARPLSIGGALTARRWTNLTITLDGDGVLCVYSDGRLVRREEVKALAAQDLTPVVGPIAGSVSELRVWSRALSRDEVDAGWQRRLSSAAGLVGRWALDKDLSGKPGKGTGAPIWREAPGLTIQSGAAAVRPTVKARASLIADQTGKGGKPQLCVDLRARDADGRSLPLCELKVIVGEEIATYRKNVRKENKIANPRDFSITTDSRGVARLAFVPKALAMPILKVRHAGMGEGEWALITPDQVLHEALASLTVNEVKQGRRKSATSKAGETGLCTEGAEELVDILRGMLSIAANFSFEAESTAALAFGDLEDEGSAEPPRPLSPVLASGESYVAELPPDISLVRRIGRPIVAVNAAEDDDAGPVSFGADEALSWFVNRVEEGVDLLDDAADGLVEVAKDTINLGMQTIENVGQMANSVVKSVTLAVNTTINGFDVALNWVVETVEQVASAVEELFKQIGKTLGDVFAFLAELFDWGDILETCDLMLSTVQDSITTAKDGVQGVFTATRGAIVGLEAKVLAALGGEATLPAIVGEARTEAAEYDLPEIPGPLDYLLSLLPDDLSETIEAFQEIFDPISDTLTSALGRLPGLAEGLGTEWNDPALQAALSDPRKLLDSDPADWLAIARLLVRLVTNATVLGLDFVGDLTIAIIESFERLLNLRLGIPILTDFVETYILGGRKMTVGRLLCLVVAIPTTVLYKAITGRKEGLAALASAGPQSFGVEDVLQSPVVDICSRAFDIFASFLGGGADSLAAFVKKPPEAKAFKWFMWGLNGTGLLIGAGQLIANPFDEENRDVPGWILFGLDVTSWIFGVVGWIAGAIDLKTGSEAAGKVDMIAGWIGDGIGAASGILNIIFTAIDDDTSAGDVWVASLDLTATIGSLAAGILLHIAEQDTEPNSKYVFATLGTLGFVVSVGAKGGAVGVVIGQTRA